MCCGATAIWNYRADGIQWHWKPHAKGQTMDITQPPREITENARAPVTVSWERGSWDKTVSSSPVHPPHVGRCWPWCCLPWASARAERHAEEVEPPREALGSRAGLPLAWGRDGCRAAAAVGRGAAGGGQPGSTSLSRQCRCSISFLCGSV